MDKISYLTTNMLPTAMATDGSPDPLQSRLLCLLNEVKQAKANSAQWLGIINGLSQKGVKASEIEDSKVRQFFETIDPSVKVTKEAVLSQIARHLPRIKCVELEVPRFGQYKNFTHGVYKEHLYILSSEAMIGDDTLEDLMYRIEDLGFNTGPLISDPYLIDRLEAEMKQIKQARPEMFDFSHHHYSSVVKNHGKNLMAHARISTVDEMVFIEEIQSDWAQRGRKSDWAKGYPKAPLVTNTEQWAGVVLRSILHEAALSPTCKRVAWINSNMRNGFNTAPDAVDHDGLSVFYASIIKKMTEKCIEKAGGKVNFSDVTTKNGVRSVMGFDMTDKVREALKLSLPLYSRDAMLPHGTVLEDAERNSERTAVVQECTTMLGSAHTIRFVAKLYDASFSNEVAGKYLEKGITLSLRAKHLDRAARHESWHFADENFLLPHEKREMRLAFSFGSELNNQTRDTLSALGLSDASLQCVDEKECAAHAFSLWCEGRMDFNPKVDTIFDVVLKSLTKLTDWLEDKVFGVQVKTPEQLFQAMRSGALAARELQAQQAQQTQEGDAQVPKA